MVSTGMKPAPLGSAYRMQPQGNESAADGGHQPISRPTPVEFRRLVSGPQENIIRAMDVSQPVFEDFKKILRDQAVMMLDCERFLHEQVPDIWALYLDWAHEELASFLSKYTDAWPVELYIEHYLSKKTYAKRHTFRAKMTRLRPAVKTARIKSSASEHDASLPPAPGGPPPPYEDHNFVQPDAAGGNDLTVENFLKTVNPDLSHLFPAFEELGINNEADLIVVKSWAPAVRKDFFERELMGRMSALQIQALNVKLGGMN
ncbi:uncharacterized protein EDB93DRAFT_910289 [Suillus bovinus]|uniref:uncharacterized protein n=1 Tax=Suillus bovinus TaxID=48563 RepID=UPI001B867B83|nr:uncharacterized protein EDB93DRAFT_910289 [Suillus bovinus]KAG2132304.1 hypothetical protein EDB93DRAFT_910289 [Suillus bovinus]